MDWNLSVKPSLFWRITKQKNQTAALFESQSESLCFSTFTSCWPLGHHIKLYYLQQCHFLGKRYSESRLFFNFKVKGLMAHLPKTNLSGASSKVQPVNHHDHLWRQYSLYWLLLLFVNHFNVIINIHGLNLQHDSGGGNGHTCPHTGLPQEVTDHKCQHPHRFILVSLL